MKSLLFTVAVLLCATVSYARIGETPAEIEARYGKPLKATKPVAPATTANVYKKGDLGYFVGFIDGKAVYEVVQEVEEDGDFGEDPLKQADIDAALKANADGEWKPAEKAEKHKRHWSSADGKLKATYDEGNHMLMIETVEFVKQHQAAGH